MTRTKVKVAFIENAARRKACFTKRSNGVIKKVQELSILCGVDTFATIVSPFDNKPIVWPKDISELNRVLSRFNELPEIEKSKHMLDNEGYLKQRIAKVCAQVQKLQMENSRTMASCILEDVHAPGMALRNLNEDDLDKVKWAISFTTEEISQKILFLRLCDQNRPHPTVTTTPAAETSYVPNQHVPRPSIRVFPEATLINTNENQNPTTAAENADQEPDTDLRLCSW